MNLYSTVAYQYHIQNFPEGVLDPPPIEDFPLNPRRGPKAGLDPTRGFSRFVLDVSPTEANLKS